MSDDRSDEFEDRAGRPDDTPEARQPASAAARRERSGRSGANPGESFRTSGKGQATRSRPGTDQPVAFPMRALRFVREAVGELRKVIWPTRKQLVTYFFVVLVFVSLMIVYIALLDLGFGRFMFYVFGD